MNINNLDSIHDLILITGMTSDTLIIIDYNTPSKKAYSTVTALLNSLNIFWFQGPRDGRVYVTRDALMYLLY